MAGREGEAPRQSYPWGDPRLWGWAVLVGGLGGMADLGWSGLIPGRSPGAWWEAAGSALVGLSVVGVALHPRSAGWTAAGNVVPAIWPVLVAFALAPPVAGPAFWRFGWTAALLLYVWSKSRAFARAAVASTLPAPVGREGVPWAPPAVGRAAVDILWGVGLWLGFCDLGAGGSVGLALGGAHLLLGAAAALGALGLASWTVKADLVRQAHAQGVGIQEAFSRLWWWALAPAVALFVTLGALVPTYPAPLQRRQLSDWILQGVRYWTTNTAAGLVPPTPAQARAANADELILAVVGLLVLLVAWPARRLAMALVDRARGRVPERPEDGLAWRERWQLWWQALADRWRRRKTSQTLLRGQGRWIPPHTVPPVRTPVAPSFVPSPAWHTDERARVRAAYRGVLGHAANLGVGRQAGVTPRRYLGWLLGRARRAEGPLSALTGRYEEARFSLHPVDVDQASKSEDDARVVRYALDMTLRDRQRQPAPAEEGLHWSAPRGFGSRKGQV